MELLLWIAVGSGVVWWFSRTQLQPNPLRVRTKAGEGTLHDERQLTSPDPQFDVEDVLDLARIDDVRERYAEFLLHGPYSNCRYKPVSVLPFPKPYLISALTALLDLSEGRRHSPHVDRSAFSGDFPTMLSSMLVDLESVYFDVPPSKLPDDPDSNFRVGSELWSESPLGQLMEEEVRRLREFRDSGKA